MDTVEFIGNIPKSLRQYAEKHADRIQEVTWSDGYCSDWGGSYEAALRPGWRKCDDYVHTLISTTAAGLIEPSFRKVHEAYCSATEAFIERQAVRKSETEEHKTGRHQQ